jgi:general secretion pathway protein G
MKGFSLIEILIVVAVIGIILSIVIGNMARSKSEARDTVRHLEADELVKAVYKYRLDNGSLPLEDELDNAYATSCNNDSNWITLQNTLDSYISRLPDDPLGTDDYCYSYSPNPSIAGGSLPSNTECQNGEFVITFKSELKEFNHLPLFNSSIPNIYCVHY